MQRSFALTLPAGFSIERSLERPSPASLHLSSLGGGYFITLRTAILDHRSATKRIFVLRPAALGLIALIALLLSGCQSNAQQDLIARELRMQEDQLYAMEEYLAQYQQLVCKYRSENAALRRRASDGYYDAEEVPAPGARPRTNAEGPLMGTPGRAPRSTEQPPRANEIDVPDVPPLEGGVLNDVDLQFRPSGIARKDVPKAKSKAKAADVVVVSHEQTASTDDIVSDVQPTRSDEAASPAGETIAADLPTAKSSPPTKPSVVIRPSHNNAAPQQVSLRGEVVPNEAGGGPRLVVDVEQLDGAGQAIPFDGDLSIMLVAMQAEGGHRKLARWDYATNDAEAAIDSPAGEFTMRFYLELPAETQLGNDSEIWVRLVSRGGDKLLAHAAIMLDRPGQFASHVDQAAPKEIPGRIASQVIEGDWTTARPGEPANLPAANEESVGEWRASSKPIPVVVTTMASAKSVSPPVQQALHQEPATNTPTPVYKPPSWSPERSAALPADSLGARQSHSVAGRPIWSAGR